MRAVLDTNVLMSDIFVAGPPAARVASWSQFRYRQMPAATKTT
jgi:hypothetical protein